MFYRDEGKTRATPYVRETGSGGTPPGTTATVRGSTVSKDSRPKRLVLRVTTTISLVTFTLTVRQDLRRRGVPRLLVGGRGDLRALVGVSVRVSKIVSQEVSAEIVDESTSRGVPCVSPVTVSAQVRPGV